MSQTTKAVPFHSGPWPPYRGLDGKLLVNNCDQFASHRDMDMFLSHCEADLDRLTVEMCKDERSKDIRQEDWLLKAETEAFLRIQKRAA